jgi:SAM-dependent methyltransferase
MAIPVPLSHTHRHILVVLNTLLGGRAAADGVVRILDLGCGDGRLIAFLATALPQLRPDLEFSIVGLDVNDSGVQRAGYVEGAIAELGRRCPGVNWSERLVCVASRDAWPFPSDGLDFVVSNQVLEHVADHEFLFAQLRRCLKPGGVSVNLFPLKEVLWEDHALMPIVHRIADEQRRSRWMLRFAKMGFRRHYARDLERYHWRSLEEFASVFSGVLQRDTNYLRSSDFRRLARASGLEPSFAYTKDYIASKVLGKLGVEVLRYRSQAVVDALGFWLGRYITSSTLLLRRPAGVLEARDMRG